MKNLNLLLLGLFALTTVTAQSSLVGTWTRPPAGDEYFSYEGLIFTADGYYYAETVYPEEYYDIVLPEFSLGVYEFNGSDLKLYNMKDDVYMHFTLEDFYGQSFRLVNNENGESWTFSFRGGPQINETIQTNLASWENFRRMGGVWRSQESTLKVIPTLGIMIIRNNTDPDFFHWGHYSFTGDELSISEISAEETIFYQGTITQFDRSGFSVYNADGSEQYVYQGELDLDEQEWMMVEQYMRMNNRLNMTTIDGLDGVRDFIWRRVENTNGW